MNTTQRTFARKRLVEICDAQLDKLAKDSSAVEQKRIVLNRVTAAEVHAAIASGKLKLVKKVGTNPGRDLGSIRNFYDISSLDRAAEKRASSLEPSNLNLKVKYLNPKEGGYYNEVTIKTQSHYDRALKIKPAFDKAVDHIMLGDALEAASALKNMASKNF